MLLIGLPIMFVTGLLSYSAYVPGLEDNGRPAHTGILHVFTVGWPTDPVWLYRVTQGVHVTLGLMLVPIVLAKLWSVIHKLFDWPPTRSVAQALERVTLLVLVGGILFELVTGIIDIQLWYPWSFDFYTAHYYGAWVFIGALIAHVGLKTPAMIRGLRGRSLRRELRTPLAETEPEVSTPETDPHELVTPNPAAPTLSRRGMLAAVGGSSLLVGLLSVGQTTDVLRRTAWLAPHGRTSEPLGNDFQVNKTAEYRNITADMVDESYRLTVVGPDGASQQLSRADLLAMPQHTYQLPIACVEGWSTSQRWTGVRLRDLAALVGVDRPRSMHAESLQQGGAFGQASYSRRQSNDEKSLLALQVNGVDLALDHGYPARVIIPAGPGVHNTKWVNRLEARA